jgi:hypothetical protein
MAQPEPVFFLALATLAACPLVLVYFFVDLMQK